MGCWGADVKVPSLAESHFEKFWLFSNTGKWHWTRQSSGHAIRELITWTRGIFSHLFNTLKSNWEQKGSKFRLVNVKVKVHDSDSSGTNNVEANGTTTRKRWTFFSWFWNVLNSFKVRSSEFVFQVDDDVDDNTIHHWVEKIELKPTRAWRWI